MAHSQLLTRRSGVCGSGVFALRPLEAGERLLAFTGPIFDRQAHRLALEHRDVDDFLQISADQYLGPSGGLDDFVNHSCEPNCGLRFSSAGICLVSIARIGAGEEVTFDYATTQNDYPYRFRCRCGSPSCRGEIGDFDELPTALKRYYDDLRVLSPWLSARFQVAPRRLRVRRQATSSSSVFNSPE